MAKIKMTKSIEKLFPGIEVFDTTPVEVENPFTGETIMLSPEEVAVYDYLKGCEMMGDHVSMRRCIDWFITNNVEAYMTLID